ncbi:prepilin-type N-terminal cleavage/methylation domain-containing protein [candidate division KSB1 bacterium]|nr:prepilin-type N-terminal cleavage/methylation domain-containing protein [candidate division KSB1 bacterium]
MKIVKKIYSFIKKERGFSLMEMVVTMVALSIIMLPVSKLVNVSVVGYTTIRNYGFVVESARIGMNIMMAELRSIETQTDISDGSTTSITLDDPASTNFTEYAFDSDNEMILFNKGYTILGFPFTNESYPLVIFVKDFEMTYYDRSDNEITVPSANLWRIQIKMVVGDDASEYALYNQVFPRQWLN